MPTKIDPTVIDEALQGVSSEVSVRNDYSGRFMFGEKCFGITFDGPDWPSFLVALTKQDPDTAEALAKSMSSDSMGLGTIYYFPGFVLDGVSVYAEPDEDDYADDDEEI